MYPGVHSWVRPGAGSASAPGTAAGGRIRPAVDAVEDEATPEVVLELETVVDVFGGEAIPEVVAVDVDDDVPPVEVEHPAAKTVRADDDEAAAGEVHCARVRRGCDGEPAPASIVRTVSRMVR